MKIQKVIFTSSEEYSDYWNINSRVYREFLGIEPVCFLFGKKSNTNMNEKYGKVIEMKFIPDIPKILQITWYKFFYTTQEPDVTWIIGDIDQVPLQRKWFTSNIINMDDDFYLHLNSTCIAQMLGRSHDAFVTKGSYIQGGADLTAHYHVAKGSTFKKSLNIRDSFKEDLNYIISQNKYGLGINKPGFFTDIEKFYWCAEENYSSETLYNNLKQNIFKYKGYHYDITSDTIDRSRMCNDNYLYDIEKLKNHEYINIHCRLPYITQESGLLNVLKTAEII